MPCEVGFVSVPRTHGFVFVSAEVIATAVDGLAELAASFVKAKCVFTPREFAGRIGGCHVRVFSTRNACGSAAEV